MSTSPASGPDAGDVAGPIQPASKRKKLSSSNGRFPCQQCQRSFGRVEHLKRHIGSHTEERPFKCPTCGKGFLRSDTLQRHEAIHDESHNKVKPKGARACFECAAAKVKCDNIVPCTRCNNRSLDCRYPVDSTGFTASSNRQAITGTALDAYRVQLPSAETAIGGPLPILSTSATKSGPLLPSISTITATHPHLSPGISSWDPNFSNANWMSTGFTPPGGFSRTGLTPTAALPSPTDTGLVAQPAVRTPASNVTSIDHDDGVNAVGRRWLDTVTRVPSLQSNLASASSVSPDQHGNSQYHTDADGIRLAKYGHMRTQTLSRLAGSKEAAITAGDWLAFMPTAISRRETHMALTAGTILIDDPTYLQIKMVFERFCVARSVPFLNSFDSQYFPSIEEFRTFIGLYIENAQPVLPVLHLATLDLSSAHWSLPLAMAAIGCQFLEGEMGSRNSRAMQELLHRSLLMMTETQDAALDTVALSSAKLLHCIGLAYAGDKRSLARASRMHGDLAEQCDTVWRGTEVEVDVPSEGNEESLSQVWRAWADVERRRRVGYAIWLLDCTLSYHHHWRPFLNVEDAKLPLPCSEVLWEAQTASQWREVMKCSASSPPLGSALHTILLDQNMPPGLGEFGRILILHGIYHREREVCDYLEQPLTYWTPTSDRQKAAQVIPTEIRLCSIPTYNRWCDVAYDGIEVLHWGANSVTASSSAIDHSTMSNLYLARIIVLSPIRAIYEFASTIAGLQTSDSGQSSRFKSDIRRWALGDRAKARLTILHAGAQFGHLRRFSSCAFYEPHAVLLSTLTLWAFGLFTDSARVDQHMTNPSFAEDEMSLPEAIDLDRPANDEMIQAFISSVSKVSAMMSGVGDICADDGPQRVLSEGVKLLCTLTHWGSADAAIRLLEALLEVPREVVMAEPG